jgi:hypothetical protein
MNLCKIVNGKAVNGDHCFGIYREDSCHTLGYFPSSMSLVQKKEGVGENAFVLDM